jgi:hypothetical protein
MLNKHNLKRVKKKINDFIIGNYHSLFTHETVTKEDILSNQKLLTKAADELRLSTEQEKAPVILLSECLAELEERGILNMLESSADQHLYKIKDQRETVRVFISDELRGAAERGLTFESIYKRVSQAFGGFYTKEFVFKAIDELFQMAVIYEVSKMTYALIPSHQ